jgi:sugar lactone lactonase YvrE
MTSTTNGTIYLIDHQELKKVDQLGHAITLTSNLTDKNQLSTNEDHYLSGISADNAENIYVADCTARRVMKVTQDGKVSVAFKTNTPWAPSGILVATNGDLWILEYSATNAVRVEKITKKGQRIIY